MIQKFKLILAGALAALGLVALVPAIASAQANIQGSVCEGANNLIVTNATADCNALPANEGNFNSLLTKIINIMSMLVGIVAVIMIIVGGFRYVTSGGDTTRVASAKNTILYGLIGLVIVAISQVIVRFVLKSVTT